MGLYVLCWNCIVQVFISNSEWHSCLLGTRTWKTPLTSAVCLINSYCDQKLVKHVYWRGAFVIKTRSKKKTLAAKRKRLVAKKNNLPAKFLRCREDILILISFAVRLRFFFLHWGYSFCLEVLLFAVSLFLFAVRFFFLLWSFSFCRESFSFAVRLFFLPWGFSVCHEVFLFAVRVFFLRWDFSFCLEVNSFAVTVVGHRTG